MTDLDHRVRAPARPSLACGLFGPVPCAWPSILYSHMMSKAPGLPLEAPPPEIANRSFGTILIVEDDPHGVIALARVVLVQGFEIRTAATVQEALVALKDDPSGLIVDLGLPDGSGFDFVKAARKESPKMPVLIVTGRLIDHKTISDAQLANVEFVGKPCANANVIAFLERCKAWRRPTVEDLVGGLVEKHDLTGAHRLFLHAAVESADFKLIARQIGRSENTVKSLASEIRARVKVHSIEEIVIPIRARIFRKK